MGKYYYFTAASGKKFINKYARISIKSLLKAGISASDIHLAINNDEDKKLVKSILPEITNLYMINEDLSHVVWKYSKGKRKYSLFKSAALHKSFPKPIEGRYMIYFDGDVLFYKDPSPFFDTKCDKTWFHHGKSLKERCPAGKAGRTVDQIDVTSYEDLSQWVSAPQAHLMVKFGAKKVPEYEVVAGLYLLHPRDHEAFLKMTYEGCLENADKFRGHEGGGDQKPTNASLSILDIDWHGGSRFFCPEHKEYFDHYFGKDDMKQKFWDRARKMGIK
jgi:hypothetical protein